MSELYEKSIAISLERIADALEAYLKQKEFVPPANTMKCEVCGHWGYPSIYNSKDGKAQCTNCANTERGFY